MTVKDLESCFDYGYWANRRLFAVVARLTDEEFTRPVGGSFGSIRNTLVHALSAEWGWLSRCGGPERGDRLDPAEYPTCESLVSAWRRVESSARELLAAMRDEDLQRNAAYTNQGQSFVMPVGELLQHAATHGVHHRGQVAMMLRMLGRPPGNFDMLFYYAEKRGVAAW